jgi:flagellar hook-length control protein FliK
LGRPARESTTPILATATVQGGSNQDNTGQPPSVNGVGREAPNSNPSSATTHEVGDECNALRLPPTDGASREVAIFSPSLAAQKATNGERSADQPVPTAAASREAPSAWSAIRDTHPHQAGSAESWNSNATSKTDDRAQFAALQLDATPGANLVTGTAVHASGTHSMVSAGPSAILLVPTPVDSPAWSKDFGQHVIRLAADGQTTAEIHLNPADWGPIRVSIDIKDQDATLQFSAEHLHTREALENALPRLREMFAAGSLTLADANVTGQSPSQHFSDTKGQRFDQSTAAAGNARSLTLEVAEPTMVASHRPTVGRSRIDLFA